jgi:membrane dipeptidase
LDEAEAIVRESVVIDMRGMPTLTGRGVEDFRASGITMGNLQGDSVEALLLRRWYIDHFDEVVLVRSAQDLLDAKAQGRMGLLLSIEHPELLGRACDDHRPVLQAHLRTLEHVYGLGVRRIQLAYNRRTMFADGCTERRDGGLSYYGVELVQRMNALGILVDCAHVGIQSSLDAIDVSSRPIIFSHTGCRAVFDHPRSKTDEALKALAEHDGVAGIYNLPYFLAADPPAATVDDFLAQIQHAVDVMGVDHVGIGTDQGIRDRSRQPDEDAIILDRATKYQPARQRAYRHFSNEINLQPPKYMPAYAHTDYMVRITRDLLGRGFSRADVTKIIGENCLRLLQATL